MKERKTYDICPVFADFAAVIDVHIEQRQHRRHHFQRTLLSSLSSCKCTASTYTDDKPHLDITSTAVFVHMCAQTRLLPEICFGHSTRLTPK